MAKIALIGGTGLTSLEGLEIKSREIVQTPYGEPSGPLVKGKFCDTDVFFLPRHGAGHTIPPHKINYLANIWALKNSGAEMVIAVNAVGGIREDMKPGVLAVPDQIVDYTLSRTNTYFEESLKQVVHIDFSYPFCEQLRQSILVAASDIELRLVTNGTYAATEGPRLETAAEINRLEKDGCDIVGMTLMPEAALAREQELCYASVAVVANRAAGRTDEELTMEMIENNLADGMQNVKKLLAAVLPGLS